MITPYKVPMVTVLYGLLLAGCSSGERTSRLAAHLGPPVHYQSASGETFVAQYGSLADDTLHFVRVQMPDGRTYTLPQVISASGVRYTDERELVWWCHQGTVRVDVRAPDGNWQTKYPALQEAPKKR